jgi:hypothetical protein
VIYPKKLDTPCSGGPYAPPKNENQLFKKVLGVLKLSISRKS